MIVSHRLDGGRMGRWCDITKAAEVVCMLDIYVGRYDDDY